MIMFRITYAQLFINLVAYKDLATLSHDSLTLTEFEPLEPEPDEPKKGVSGFIERLFKRKDEKEPIQRSQSGSVLEQAEADVVAASAVVAAVPPATPTVVPSKSVDDIAAIVRRSSATHSIAMVSQRISAFLNLAPALQLASGIKAIGQEPKLMDYNRSDFRQYWMPDARGKECYDCQEKFTTFRRRHHCRICGQIFCSKCCHHVIPGRILGYTGELRLCTYCCRAVVAYLDTPEGQKTLSRAKAPEVTHLRENLLSSLAESVTQSGNHGGAPASPRNLVMSGSAAAIGGPFLPNTLSESSSGTEFGKTAYQDLGEVWNLKDDRSEFYDYRGSFGDALPGLEVPVKSLLTHDFTIGESGSASPVPPHITLPTIEEARLRSLSNPDATLLDSEEIEEEPEWFRSIEVGREPSIMLNGRTPDDGMLTRAYSGDIDLVDGRHAVSPMSARKFQMSPRTSECNQTSDAVFVAPIGVDREVSMSVKRRANRLDSGNAQPNSLSIPRLFDEHGQHYLKYLLCRERMLDAEWFDVLWPLAKQIGHTLQVDIKSRKDFVADVTESMHVKTLVSEESLKFEKPTAQVIFGTLCTKTVVDARMRQNFLKPRILILKGALEYERVEGKFCSIDPVISQEADYLRAAVAKIAALKPQVVVVENSVARLAQDFLRRSRITLVSNVKVSVIKRLARCTQADVPSSVDALIAKPRLGCCGCFRTESYTLANGMVKTLMFFEDCPPSLCCSVLLSGPSRQSLLAAKRVFKFIVGTIYSGKLEAEMLRLMHASIRPEAQLLTYMSDTSEPPTDEDCKACWAGSRMTPQGEHIGQEGTNFDNHSLHELCNALPHAVLSSSPLIRVRLPYLETKAGKACRLRGTFKGTIFPFDISRLLPVTEANKKGLTTAEELPRRHPTLSAQCENNSLDHPFVFAKLTKPIQDKSVQGMLARYRAQSSGMFRARVEKAYSSNTHKKSQVLPRKSSQGIDVLNPFLHQSISVLYSSYSEKSPLSPGFCTAPWVVPMGFYSHNDIPFGSFLERHCFQAGLKCSVVSCEVRMLHHTRKFVHGNACVEVSMEQIVDSPPDGNSVEHIANANSMLNAEDEQIMMWSWCTQCKLSSTPVVLSDLMWHLSLAKYLDYRLNGVAIGSLIADSECFDCLFHQHTHFFARRHVAVCIKTTMIDLYDISFPPPSIDIEPYFVSVSELVHGAKCLSELAGSVFGSMSDQLELVDSLSAEQIKIAAQARQDLSRVYSEAQDQQRKCSADIQENLSSLANQDSVSVYDQPYVAMRNATMRCKQVVLHAVNQWNILVNDFAYAVKKQKATPAEDKAPIRAEAPGSSSGNNSAAVTPSHSQASIQPCVVSAANLEEQVGGALGKRDSPGVSKSEEQPPVASVQKLRSEEKKTIFSAKAYPFQSLQVPFEYNLHYSLDFGRVPVVINDSEVSSVIAYALSSKAYDDKLKEAREQFLDQNIAISLKYSQFIEDKIMHEIADLSSVFSSSGIGSVLSSSDSNQNASAALQHIELQFGDSYAKFYCKIYYAEHFRMLRKLIFPQGEEAFIRSLGSCSAWTPQGGKSGSSFYKTGDERFVLKQMSRFEIQSFLKFAGNYFHYMATACTENKLTALAKIVGVFRIGFHNQQTGAAIKLDLLVLENMFYRRNVTQVFDLKGSVRNRLASEKPSTDLVLLDENLLKRTCLNPFYVYPHSKSAFNSAVHSDSFFLCSNAIMDYSLLVGVDDERKELVVGIIDYIRTYTWDKRLESWVKSVGGLHSSQPTVISPESYRKRFTDAIALYFPVSPDQWTGLGYGISLD